MMVTMLQSTNQVETFSGARAVISAPVGRRDVHRRMLARELGIGKASALLPVTMPRHRAQEALHRVRERLVRQRTGIINQIRAFLLERGNAVRQGFRCLRTESFSTKL